MGNWFLGKNKRKNCYCLEREMEREMERDGRGKSKVKALFLNNPTHLSTYIHLSRLSSSLVYNIFPIALDSMWNTGSCHLFINGLIICPLRHSLGSLRPSRMTRLKLIPAKPPEQIVSIIIQICNNNKCNNTSTTLNCRVMLQVWRLLIVILHLLPTCLPWFIKNSTFYLNFSGQMKFKVLDLLNVLQR